MQSTTKTILIWVLILVAAVGLYSFVERSGGRTPRVLDLTAFLSKVETGEVKDVAIRGLQLTGHLTAGNEPFSSTIPEDYSLVYDKLTAAGVRVMIVPAEQSSWLGASWTELPAVLVVAGLVLWIAISGAILVLVVDLSRFVKRELARSGGNPSTA